MRRKLFQRFGARRNRTAHVAYILHGAAHKDMSPTLDFLVQAAHFLIHTAAQALLVDGCLMEIPCLCAGIPVGEILEQLGTVGQVAVHLKTQVCHGGDRVGRVGGAKGKGPERLARFLGCL